MDLMLLILILFAIVAVLSLCAAIHTLQEIRVCHKKYIIAIRALAREEFECRRASGK